MLFTAVTLATMIGVVILGLRGFSLIRRPGLERHAHTFAGLAVLACGLSVRYLGL